MCCKWKSVPRVSCRTTTISHCIVSHAVIHEPCRRCLSASAGCSSNTLGRWVTAVNTSHISICWSVVELSSKGCLTHCGLVRSVRCKANIHFEITVGYLSHMNSRWKEPVVVFISCFSDISHQSVLTLSCTDNYKRSSFIFKSEIIINVWIYLEVFHKGPCNICRELNPVPNVQGLSLDLHTSLVKEILKKPP